CQLLLLAQRHQGQPSATLPGPAAYLLGLFLRLLQALALKHRQGEASAVRAGGQADGQAVPLPQRVLAFLPTRGVPQPQRLRPPGCASACSRSCPVVASHSRTGCGLLASVANRRPTATASRAPAASAGSASGVWAPSASPRR